MGLGQAEDTLKCNGLVCHRRDTAAEAGTGHMRREAWLGDTSSYRVHGPTKKILRCSVTNTTNSPMPECRLPVSFFLPGHMSCRHTPRLQSPSAPSTLHIAFVGSQRLSVEHASSCCSTHKAATVRPRYDRGTRGTGGREGRGGSHFVRNEFGERRRTSAGVLIQNPTKRERQAQYSRLNL